MKRHTFALTILLAALAGPLLTVGSARCQNGAPNYRNQCVVCPLLEEHCNDYLYYYGAGRIADAKFDNEQLDPRFDPDTGRYIGHDEVNPIGAQTETAAVNDELDAFYSQCEDTCNADIQQAYTSSVAVEAKTAAKPAVENLDADRYNEEYYDDYGYDYEDYEYEAEDYWYEESADTEEAAQVEEEEVVSDESNYDDTYDYDYGYDEYDNYDYEYETYDYEAYDYEAESAAVEETHPPVVDQEVLAAEDAAAEAWDYEAEGYDPYAYDYEAYQYDYEVYENGAVATPVEDVQPEAEVTEESGFEQDGDFAETWTNPETQYSYEYDYNYDYDYDYSYEAQPVTEEAASRETEAATPVAAAVTRQALLSAANLLDSMSQLLKSASDSLEHTASLESNLR